MDDREIDLKQKFHDLSKQYSPEARGFFAHFTSVIVRPIFHIYYDILSSSAFIMLFSLRLFFVGYDRDVNHASYR